MSTDLIAESKKNHLWRKTVWHTDPEDYPLGPHHSAEIYCCEEANGYSVWYVRRLAKDDKRGLNKAENADYLLNFYGKTRRDDAIERAVLLANSDSVPEKVIDALDMLAAAVHKV